MAVDKVIGIVICGAIIVGTQYLAVQAYESWWKSETGGDAAVPQSAVQFLTFVVSLGVSAIILKVWPDES